MPVTLSLMPQNMRRFLVTQYDLSMKPTTLIDSISAIGRYAKRNGFLLQIDIITGKLSSIMDEISL